MNAKPQAIPYSDRMKKPPRRVMENIKRVVRDTLHRGAVVYNDDWNEELAKNTRMPLRVLGSGISRVVVTHESYPDFVFKVAKYDAYQNQAEVTTFEGLTNRQREFVAKCFKWSEDYGVVVSERIIGELVEQKPNYDDIMYDVDNLNQKEFGGKLDDLHGANVMVKFDGSMVIVDYGFSWGR